MRQMRATPVTDGQNFPLILLSRVGLRTSVAAFFIFVAINSVLVVAGVCGYHLRNLRLYTTTDFSNCPQPWACSSEASQSRLRLLTSLVG